MSKFDLRDISERLTSSRNTEAVLFEFLGYLQAVRPEWEATLAFYEVSRDALVNVLSASGTRLQRKDLLLQVDALPPRLVRGFVRFCPNPPLRDASTKLARASHAG